MKNPRTQTRSTSAGRTLLFAAAMTAMTLASSTAMAQTETVIHSFNVNVTTDYAYPTAPLIADASGNLYGTSSFGGPGSQGGVFELSPPAVLGGDWTETLLLSFDDGADGGGPQAGLVMDTNGSLYGTTAGGGSAGDGVVFQLSPPAVQGGTWTETVLYSFSGNTDGDAPYGGLIFDQAGNLYGTTVAGGPGHGGNVFKLAPPATSGSTWTFSVLHNFNSSSTSTAYAGGCEPEANVTLGPHGSLYGTTTACGANGGGVVFKLSPPNSGHTGWQETVLHAFGPANKLGDGATPRGGIIVGQGGVLFGTTSQGGTRYGGTAYELFPPTTSGGAWTEQILASFTGLNNVGYQAWGNLLLNSSGALYGVTIASNLYKLTPPATLGNPWTETVLETFGGTSGFEPMAGVLEFNGALYGTTNMGGGYGNGTVYEITF